MELRLTNAQLAKLRRERTDEPTKIGVAIRLLRCRQQDLVDATGLPKSHISEIRNGKRLGVSLATARKIASAFGVCIEDIFPPACARPRRAA